MTMNISRFPKQVVKLCWFRGEIYASVLPIQIHKYREVSEY